MIRATTRVTAVIIATLVSVFLMPQVNADDTSGIVADRGELETKAALALKSLFDQHPAAEKIVGDVAGVLVFPEITKGGVIVGVESGNGVLRRDDETIAFYEMTSISIGYQFGLQSYAYVMMFLSEDGLNSFMSRIGFEVGVDGSVAVLDLGATADIDTSDLDSELVAFIFDEAGLMLNVAVEGSKFRRLDD